MRVVSWNVQGLGGTKCARYRGRLRQELQRCLVGGSIDVFLIQEHHLSEHRIKRYGSVLRGKSDMFWSACFGPMGGQGVCMYVCCGSLAICYQRQGDSCSEQSTIYYNAVP